MLEVYKPHTNREAVGVWLCSAAKRPSKRCTLVLHKTRALRSVWNFDIQGTSSQLSHAPKLFNMHYVF